MSTAVFIALTSAGAFLMVGLLCGVWKFQQIHSSPESRAHRYVDIAHRAALLYSFACAVMAQLVAYSPDPPWVQITATSVPIFFFATAVVTYIWHGWRRDTENQFKGSGSLMTWGTILLIIGEVGGVGVILIGFIRAA